MSALSVLARAPDADNEVRDIVLSMVEVTGVRNKWEMVLLLNEKGIPIDYTAKDAEKDLETLKEVLGR